MPKEFWLPEIYFWREDFDTAIGPVQRGKKEDAREREAGKVVWFVDWRDFCGRSRSPLHFTNTRRFEYKFFELKSKIPIPRCQAVFWLRVEAAPTYSITSDSPALFNLLAADDGVNGFMVPLQPGH